jgi:hypothetical protein
VSVEVVVSVPPNFEIPWKNNKKSLKKNNFETSRGSLSSEGYSSRRRRSNKNALWNRIDDGAGSNSSFTRFEYRCSLLKKLKSLKNINIETSRVSLLSEEYMWEEASPTLATKYEVNLHERRGVMDTLPEC